jgi:nucleotide-binding universal stress UspA family protein
MFDSKGSTRMYANILLSTDGSEVAREGVKHGIALAKALNAKVIVITVTESLPVDWERTRLGMDSLEGRG